MQTILVCDDDKEIVEAIEIYLQQEGFHVLKAYDGEEALEILKNNEVHLLIMDVMMPKLDGIRATLKIRENSSIPIIILSAKTEEKYFLSTRFMRASGMRMRSERIIQWQYTSAISARR